MNFNATLALFTRSLREDNRLKQTYLARGVLVAFILLLLTQAQSASSIGGAPGLSFFKSIIYTNFFFISLTGLSYFASAVAEEKEDLTLGLLRMTNLGSMSILLGKSTSRLCGVFLLLLVQLPFTLLAVTLGGVSLNQVLAAYCTLGAYIFLLCNVALLFSTISSRVSTASTLTGGAMLAFFFLPFLGLGLVSWLTFLKVWDATSVYQRGISWLLGALIAASPFGQLGIILSTGFGASPIGFQVLSNLILGALCFLLAWVGFDVFTRNQKEPAPGRAFIFRRTSRWGAFGAGRAWPRAVLWKDFYFVAGGWTWMLCKTLCYGLLVFLIGYNMLYGRQLIDDSFWRNLSEVTFGIFLVICAIELVFAAARIFRVEAQSKTLSGLAGLPVSFGSIALQKIFAALLGVLPAVGFIFVSFVLLWGLNERSIFNDKEVWLAGFAACSQLILLLTMTAYFSLKLKRLAIPAALAVVYFGNMFVGVFAGILFGRALGGAFNAEILLVFYHAVLLAFAALIGQGVIAQMNKLAAAES